jgi:hypothetical protein
VDLSETCRVLCQINLRNGASRWLSLQEYITMHGPLNVKFAPVFCTTLKTKQFSLGCVAKQRGEVTKRFGDMKGKSEPFNKFHILHVRLRAGR